LCIAEAQDVKKLAKADGVVSIYPVQYYEAPAYISPTPLPSPSNLSARAFEYGKYSVLPSIQADRVHARGVTGSGVKVAVIDSGVDFNLAALGGGFGPGFKVEGGYDLVGPTYGSGGAPSPGDVPFDDCNGHGTLVAGLIAGNDNEYQSPGVAPDARIYAYRIFGCSGSTSDDLVIDAMLRAVRDGCDVINLSLGECIACKS
jgi:subtilisin family serine protease